MPKKIKDMQKVKTTATTETVVQPKATDEVIVAEAKPCLTKPQETLLAKKLANQIKILAKHGGDVFDPTGGCLLKDLPDTKFLPTGLPVFDEEVLGIGGIAQGKFTEIYGMKSSGKSALSMFLAGTVQKTNLMAMVKVYDLETSMTKPWGIALGLDPSRTLIAKVKNAETMADQIMEDLASEYPPEIIIIDSIAVVQAENVASKAIKDRTMKDNLARSTFLTQFFDTITAGYLFPPLAKGHKKTAQHKMVRLGDCPTAIICINHAKLRTKTIGGGKTIQEWYSVGGVALDFHACMQLMVTRIGFEGQKDNITHQRIRVCADKNKLAPPKRSCELLLSFQGEGIEQVGTVDYLTAAVTKGLAEVNGAWIKSVLVPGGKIQGKENFNAHVHETASSKAMLVT